MVYYGASKAEFLESLRRGNRAKKLICYGCGELWKQAVKSLDLYTDLYLMIDNGIRETEIIFPDKSVQHVSCHSSSEVAERIEKQQEEAFVLLVTSKFWRQIIEDLEQKPAFDGIDVFIWSLMEIEETSLEKMYQSRLINPAGEYYKKLLTFQGISEEKQGKMLREKEAYMQEKDAFGKYAHLVIPKIVFFLTTRCTLKCKECTALIPQFTSKIDMEADRVLRDMENVLEAVDEVIFVQLAGGEALLYPELGRILAFLLTNEKVRGITFVTNATIIPDEEILKFLADPKVYVTISDYGLLRNLCEVVSLFEKKGIAFELLSELSWQKVGGTEYRNKEMPQLKFEYLRCGNGMGCKMVENGHLHICDRSARMYMLNRFRSNHDYVSLSCGIEDRRARIRDIYLADYAEACNYCDYANVEAEIIAPAEQAGAQLQRSGYTIVKRQNGF